MHLNSGSNGAEFNVSETYGRVAVYVGPGARTVPFVIQPGQVRFLEVMEVIGWHLGQLIQTPTQLTICYMRPQRLR